MSTSITIQKATPEDALEIGDVFYRTWLATYPNKEVGLTTDDVEDLWKNRGNADGSRFKSFPDNELFLTVKVEGHVVGVCSAVKHDPVGEPSGDFTKSPAGSDINELKAIYVLPEYQGRGVGKMFWSEILKYFDPNKNIKVEVATYNAKAIEFYKKLGFEDTGKRVPMKINFKSGAVITEMEMELPASKVF